MIPARHRCRALLLLALCASAGLASAQVKDIGEYLQRMDLDGDGRISLDEYLQWMLYAFDRMDRNGDGSLSADELPAGRGQPISRAQHRQNLIERFHRQDVDGDGYLNARELAAPPR